MKNVAARIISRSVRAARVVAVAVAACVTAIWESNGSCNVILMRGDQRLQNATGILRGLMIRKGTHGCLANDSLVRRPG